AVGFDYRWAQNPSWHFVFDLRYGRSKKTSVNSSSSSFSTVTSFHSTFPFFTSTITKTSNSSTTTGTLRESHLVADFMIGRDLGVGLASLHQVQFGIRIADLYAKAQATQNNQSSISVTTINGNFYDS